METSLKVTAGAGPEVTPPPGPIFSPTEQIVWALLQVDPRLTRRTEQPRLRRLARLLDQSEDALLIALERIRAWAHEGRLDPSVFKTRHKYPPPARRAAIALAEILAQCGGQRLDAAAARDRIAGLVDAIGHPRISGEVQAASIVIPSLPNLGAPVAPVTPWPSEARDMLGIRAFSLRLSPAKARLLALIHLDPRLTRHLHSDRLRMLMELFDPAMEMIDVEKRIGAWRSLQREDPILAHCFGHYPVESPCRSDCEKIVDQLGSLCGWNSLSPDAIRIRRRRALMLLGHLN